MLGGRFNPWHSGLGIQHCRSCGLGCNCGSDLIPGPGDLYAKEQTKKEKKKRKKNSRSSTLPGSAGSQLKETCWGFVKAQAHSFHCPAHDSLAFPLINSTPGELQRDGPNSNHGITRETVKCLSDSEGSECHRDKGQSSILSNNGGL